MPTIPRSPTTAIWIFAALMSSAMLALPAKADEAASLKAFLQCRQISDNNARLACYDAAGQAAAPAATAPTAAKPKSPEEEKRAVEESFGHEALPVAQKEAAKKAQEYRAKVAVFSSDAYGNLILVLDNGQVWRQTDGLETQLLTGEQWVTIHRAAMGSYLITIESVHRSYRFKRIK